MRDVLTAHFLPPHAVPLYGHTDPLAVHPLLEACLLYLVAVVQEVSISIPGCFLDASSFTERALRTSTAGSNTMF